MKLDLNALEVGAAHAQTHGWVWPSPEQTLALICIARAAVAWRDCGYEIQRSDPVVAALGQALLDAGL